MGYCTATTEDASASQRVTTSDAQLVAAAQRGEPAAYAELCWRHREMVFRTVLKIIGNVDDADDVLQDAWMSDCSAVAHTGFSFPVISVAIYWPIASFK